MLKTSSIFGDGMVLQRDAMVSIFGETDYEGIEVSFDNEIYKAKIEDGKWLAQIKTGAFDGSLHQLKIVGHSHDKQEGIIYKDIILGDVWLAGGQSNMELELRNSQDGEAVAAAANFDNIRFYNVPKIPVEGKELEEAEANTSWCKVKGDACRYMSAVAYYFATRLHKENGVPIGIIDCYWGGTSATCWVSEEALSDVDEVKDYLKEWDDVCKGKSDEEYDAELKEYNDRVDTWVSIESEVKAKNPHAEFKDVYEAAGDYPWPSPRGKKSAFRPFGLHKTMVTRIAPYTVKGIIYYQAEEDVDRAAYYSKLNSAVIKQWRTDFTSADEDGVIPFYLTQLPMFISKDCEDDKKWCVLRQQQELVTKINDKTGMAVICDCGEFDNIHPIDKKTPGTRLAQCVLADVYENDLGLHNLTVRNAVFDGNKCILELDNTYGGLCYRKTDGSTLTAWGENILLEDGAVDNGIIYGFEISTSDEKSFIIPEIYIDGNKIMLTNRSGYDITDVRYGWFNYGVVNVYSKAGIPLMPFWIKK